MQRLRAAALALCGTVCGPLHAATLYIQTNLVSDIAGMAAHTDANLKNPWGMSFSPTSPFWVSDQMTNVSTLYNGAGVPQALIVSTPASPTGQVFANLPGNFIVGTNPALFIFASLSGTLSGWNMAAGTTAVTKFTATDGAVFTGLAIGAAGGNNFLYASDVSNGRIDAFDSTFAPATLTGAFTDPGLPAGYAPYNIQNVGGKLYVEYEVRGSSSGGIVDVFDTNGNFLQRLATTTGLNQPWGITMAPAGFGSFGGDLLVGNFGNGTISAFDPASGTFLGTLSGLGGPIVNSGLWSLDFRAAGSGFDPNTLFITAGINGQKDGLFAAIQPVPEPSTLALMALGAGVLGLARRRARRRLHTSTVPPSTTMV